MGKIEQKTKDLVEDFDLSEWFLGKPESNEYAKDIVEFIENVFFHCYKRFNANTIISTLQLDYLSI